MSVDEAKSRASSKPRKIDIAAGKDWQQVGGNVEYRVTLRDARNHAVKAERDTPIIVVAKAPSGKEQTLTLDFKPGETSKTFELPATEAGFTEVTARHKNDQLLSGSTLLFVAGKNKDKDSLRDTRQKPTKRQQPSMTSPRTALWYEAELIPAAFRGPEEQVQVRASRQLWLGVTNTKILANSVDAAEVQACITGAVRPGDGVQIFFSHQSGVLDPDPLVIPPGKICGKAKFTSDRPGVVQLKYQHASIDLDAEGDKDSTVSFVPLITDFKLRGPSAMTLVDTAELVAEFYGENNRLIPVGEKKVLSFSSTGAPGELKPPQIEVAPDSWDARTSIYPAMRGKRVIYATTSGYPPATFTITVVLWPVLLIGLIGGLVGGYVGFQVNKDQFVRRLLIGIAAGFLLVWLAVWGFISALSTPIVRNVISTFFIAMGGGYVGLPVFDFFAPKLGFSTQKPGRP